MTTAAEQPNAATGDRKPMTARRLVQRRLARVLAGKATRLAIREAAGVIFRNRPLCGAFARSTGRPCEAPCWVRADGSIAPRCKLHGGKSTGPKTQAGKNRSELARVVGYYRWLEKRRNALFDSLGAAGRWLKKNRPTPGTDL
ncbi:MAG TPA: HGGxSTG domain-containing protein [Burkholderiales bacterium]|nr:HGGxSTG domain-containing protein [Burkholderiales bacterium]